MLQDVHAIASLGASQTVRLIVPSPEVTWCTSSHSQVYGSNPYDYASDLANTLLHFCGFNGELQVDIERLAHGIDPASAASEVYKSVVSLRDTGGY